jgi:hypothetical protein
MLRVANARLIHRTDALFSASDKNVIFLVILILGASITFPDG